MKESSGELYIWMKSKSENLFEPWWQPVWSKRWAITHVKNWINVVDLVSSRLSLISAAWSQKKLGRRISAPHVLTDTLNIFLKGKQTKMYHGMLNSKHFLTWIVNVFDAIDFSVISNGEIVMYNTKCHFSLPDAIPKDNWKKTENAGSVHCPINTILFLAYQVRFVGEASEYYRLYVIRWVKILVLELSTMRYITLIDLILLDRSCLGQGQWRCLETIHDNCNLCSYS